MIQICSGRWRIVYCLETSFTAALNLVGYPHELNGDEDAKAESDPEVKADAVDEVMDAPYEECHSS
jgi:hypothetical protein